MIITTVYMTSLGTQCPHKFMLLLVKSFIVYGSDSQGFNLRHSPAGVNSDTLTNHITGNLGGIEVPWPGLDTDACNYATCPVTVGTRVHWEMPVEILTEYPAVCSVTSYNFLSLTTVTSYSFLSPYIPLMLT